jgi:hypothetical protein
VGCGNCRLYNCGARGAGDRSGDDYTWTGANSSPDWTTAGNWSPGEPSGSVGTLTFPDLNAVPCVSPDTCYTSADDFDGALSINELDIDDTDNYLIENVGINPSLSIGSGGVQATATPDSTGNSATIAVPITLTAPQTWTFGASVNPADGYQGQLEVGQGVSGNEMLTLTAPQGFANTHGPPLVEINGNDSHLDSEVGPIDVDNGVNLQLAVGPELNMSDLNLIDVTSTSLLSVIDAPAETGPISVTDGDLVLGVGESPDGSIAATGNVTLDSSSTADFYIDDNGSTPSTDYTQLSATGDISLGGSGLSLQQGTVGGGTCVTLTAGDTATLVSDPTGTISGTFESAANGAIIPMSGCGSEAYPVRITYAAHTVTATVLSRATTTALSAPSSATATKPVTLTATVTGAGAPTGTVAFSDGADVIYGCGSVALSAGAGDTATATCTASFTGASSPESLTAAFSGSGDFDNSATASPTSLTVAKIGTATSLVASSNSAAAGSQVTYTAAVTPSQAGTPGPSGSVEFFDGASPIGGCTAQALGMNLKATCAKTYTGGGTQTVTARYGGDANFAPSTSGKQTVKVIPPAGSGTPKVNAAHVTTTTTSSGTPEVVVPVSCPPGGPSCTVKMVLTIQTGHKTVVVGTETITIKAGKSGRVAVRLNSTGHKLLAKQRSLRIELTVTHMVKGKTKTLATKRLTLELKRK